MRLLLDLDEPRELFELELFDDDDFDLELFANDGLLGVFLYDDDEDEELERCFDSLLDSFVRFSKASITDLSLNSFGG